MPEENNFYTIMPKEVRYDKKLSPKAKLLFTEIPTFKKNSIGDYVVNLEVLSNLYHVSKYAIYRHLKQLEKRGHVINVMGNSRNISVLVHLSQKYKYMIDNYLRGKFYE